jgi:hypothetical protein
VRHRERKAKSLVCLSRSLLWLAHGRDLAGSEVVDVAADFDILDRGLKLWSGAKLSNIAFDGLCRVDDSHLESGLVVPSAPRDVSRSQIVPDEEPRAAIGVVDESDLEPTGIRRQVFVEMQNPQEILDDSRGHSPADIAGDDGFAELGADDRGGFDARVDASDQIEPLTGNERDLRNVVLGVGAAN